MPTAETLPAEGSRYAASLVLVPGLWAGTPVWRGFASFLAHRGWECHLLDVRDVRADTAARAAAVAAYATALPTPSVLLGHDAGGLVALAAAPAAGAAAAVLVSPLLPGSRAVRSLARAPRVLLALLLGRDVPPPGREAASPAPVPLAPESAAAVRDVLWGRVRPTPAGIPTLVVAGDRDPLLPLDDAEALARTLGAERATIAGAGHWPLVDATWQQTAGVVHRWLVQRLGAPLLELYPEAMAERDAETEDEGE
jgi:pimeloyl-ACP methyl ester carboxylesterase